MNKDELSVRRFAGNGDVLCNLAKCPFNQVVDTNTAFCTLFKATLTYCETGNNDICDRCQACMNK